jgi:peptidoglycan/xylan/chitin deacetylase (PgdA/CDA1 family)/glycosyltransferase involved in cell wall biosynthesis
MSTVEASVVIPTTGNPAHLDTCLQSLARQTVRTGFEIVVALDGNIERYSEGLRPLMARDDWSCPIRWLMPGTRRGAHAACNRGAAEAKGENLIFLDDDMIAEPGFIAEHLRLLGQNPHTVIVGAIKTRCIGYGGAYRFALENFWNVRHQRLTLKPDVQFNDCYSGNLSMPSEIFRRLGGFDDALAAKGDLEFGMRLERAKVPMRFGASALTVQQYDKSPTQRMQELKVQGLCGAILWKRYDNIRPRTIFAVCRNGRRKYRWLRRIALNSPLHPEDLAFVLPYLPSGRFAERLVLFFEELSRTRGARGEFGEDQWSAITEGTVILCYHQFSPPRGEQGPFVIPVDRFVQQIKHMRRVGYRFVTLGEWLRARESGELISGSTAIITIDDGTDDFLHAAAPFLRREGIPATLYIASRLIGKPGHLTTTQIKALASEGFEIGSHSLSHPKLTKVSAEQQSDEIRNSRSELADLTGTVPQTFAYPYGYCDLATARLAEEAGYKAAMGVERGYAYLHSDSWTLPRFVIDGRWSLWRFRLILSSAIGLWGWF